MRSIKERRAQQSLHFRSTHPPYQLCLIHSTLSMALFSYISGNRSSPIQYQASQTCIRLDQKQVYGNHTRTCTFVCIKVCLIFQMRWKHYKDYPDKHFNILTVQPFLCYSVPPANQQKCSHNFFISETLMSSCQQFVCDHVN